MGVQLPAGEFRRRLKDLWAPRYTFRRQLALKREIASPAAVRQQRRGWARRICRVLRLTVEKTGDRRRSGGRRGGLLGLKKNRKREIVEPLALTAGVNRPHRFYNLRASSSLTFTDYYPFRAPLAALITRCPENFPPFPVLASSFSRPPTSCLEPVPPPPFSSIHSRFFSIQGEGVVLCSADSQLMRREQIRETSRA